VPGGTWGWHAPTVGILLGIVSEASAGFFLSRALTCPRVSVGALTRDARRPGSGIAALRDRALGNPVVATLIALTALAAFLRFWRLGHQGFWFDEANTSYDVQRSLGRMFGLLPQNETTPPLFYCVAWVWGRVFGFGQTSLRTIPALAGVASVPMVYLAGSRLISRRGALIAAALTACNPFLIWYSQEFRPYEPLVLLSAAGLLAFAIARDDPTPRAMIAWGVISALALADHYYALLLVVPQAIWLLWLYRRNRAVQIAFVAVAVVGLALLPLAIKQNHTGNASWIAPIPLGPRLGQIIPNFLIGFQAPAARVLERIADVVVIIGLVLLVTRADRSEQRGAVIAGVLGISGLVINLLLIAVGIDDLITRNIIGLWVPAALVVAAGMGARRAGVVGLLATVAICATGVIAAVGVATERKFQRPDWHAVAHLLGREPAPGVGARLILVQHYRDALPLSLYLPGLTFVRGHEAPAVSEFDVVRISAPRVRLCWWGAACNLSGSDLQASYALPGFHEVWRRAQLQFTVVHMVSSKPVRVTRAIVSQILTTTSLRRDELLLQHSPG
jgi:Dolichyl-phosphate-mannose-protein mannosyltransferase